MDCHLYNKKGDKLDTQITNAINFDNINFKTTTFISLRISIGNLIKKNQKGLLSSTF